jgi:hypothetical protein
MSDQAQQTELLALYDQVDAEIAVENPRCDVSGRCCRFSEYGHTLFLSAAEAELLFSIAAQPTEPKAECPYQIVGRCTARERRPLGCRIYFCDPRYADRMIEISEAAIARLKALHDEWGRPWDYRPLGRFLAEFEIGPSPAKAKDDLLPIIDQSRV